MKYIDGILTRTITSPSASLLISGSVTIVGTTQFLGNAVFDRGLPYTSTGSNTFNGNQIISGSVTSTYGFTGSLQGTSSWSTNAVNAPNYVLNSITSSMLSSYVLNSSTSSMLARYATTSSNAFNGNQTITGSLIITQNLTVLGSSSITYLTASQLNVSSSYISVNTLSPALRFGGLYVYDSGSASTASLSWDSLNNKWIYTNSSDAGYSGGALMSGPRNTGSIGQERTPTTNYVLKGQGGDHMVESNIFDDGTKVSINSNVAITGSTAITSNLSVGTTSTTSPITVISSTSPLMHIQSTTADSYSNIRFAGTGRNYTVGVGNASETLFTVANKYFVYDDTAGAMRMTIDSSGNMGIGTTTPASLLHVQGNITASGNIIAQTNLVSANSIGDEGGEITLYKSVTNNTLTGSGITIDSYQNRLRFFEQGGNARGAYLDITELGAGVATPLTPLDQQFIAMQAMGSTIKGYNVGCPIITLATSGQALVSGQGTYTAIYISLNTTITGVKWFQQTQGNYTANNYNGVGLYSTSGGTLTLVASSSNDGNIWKAATGTFPSKSFGSTYSATPGIYYIGALYSNSAVVTNPAIGFAGSAAAGTANLGSLDFTNGHRTNATSGSGLTALPTAGTSTTFSTIQHRFAFYLY